MATRAITVSIERSPSGLHGWFVVIGQREKWLCGSELSKMAWIRAELEAAGIEQGERARVLRCLIRELDRRRKAEAIAEVLHV